MFPTSSRTTPNFFNAKYALYMYTFFSTTKSGSVGCNLKDYFIYLLFLRFKFFKEWTWSWGTLGIWTSSASSFEFWKSRCRNRNSTFKSWFLGKLGFFLVKLRRFCKLYYTQSPPIRNDDQSRWHTALFLQIRFTGK